jgi:hypothetical protein
MCITGSGSERICGIPLPKDKGLRRGDRDQVLAWNDRRITPCLEWLAG